MNYYHIIYNSSEKSRGGTVGLGIRSATENTPAEIIEALSNKDNEIFAFVERPALSQPALAADPTKVLDVAPTYFYRELLLPGKQKIYVIGRKIAVGYDYTYYKDGKSGRPGNYVVDCYVFEEQPDASVFEIFTENPAEGSAHFIPRSPVPSPDNEEMRSISLGHKPDLPAENLSFKAAAAPAAGARTAELLLAFVESRRAGRPVLVKCDVADANLLAAGAASMLRPERLTEFTFLTNHTSEGKKPGYNVFFINQHYNNELFPKQWVMLDLTKDAKISTSEAENYREAIVSAIDGDRRDKVADIIDWLLSDTYERYKNLPKETQAQLFNYIYDFSRFNFDALSRDRELVKALNEYFTAKPSEKARFDEYLQSLFDAQTDLEGTMAWIEYVLAVKPLKATEVIERNRDKITSIVFADKDTFDTFYRRFKQRFVDVQQFINRSAYKSHSDYLTLSGGEWESLYHYFLDEKGREPQALIARMLDDGLDQRRRMSIIENEVADREVIADSMIKLITTEQRYEDALVADLIDLSGRCALRYRDFVGKIFADRITDPRYSRLFTYALEHASVNNAEGIRSMVERLDAFHKSPDSDTWGAGQGKVVFKRLLNAIKDAVRNKTLSRENAADLCFNVYEIGYPRTVTEDFRELGSMLNHVTDEVATDSAWLRMQDLALELADYEFLRQISTKLFNVKGADARKLAKVYLDRNIYSPEQLMKSSARSPQRDDYWVAVMSVDPKAKPEVLLETLTAQSLSDDEAMAFLSRHFPEAHHKIERSRRPSFFAKILSIFKKKDSDKAEDELPDAAPKGKVTSKPKADSKSRKTPPPYKKN